MAKQPYRIKVFEDTGKSIFEFSDPDPDTLIRKTAKAFRDKFQ